jgi:hypothetical protein
MPTPLYAPCVPNIVAPYIKFAPIVFVFCAYAPADNSNSDSSSFALRFNLMAQKFKVSLNHASKLLNAMLKDVRMKYENFVVIGLTRIGRFVEQIITAFSLSVL